jgi:hypothetical protein
MISKAYSHSRASSGAWKRSPTVIFSRVSLAVAAQGRGVKPGMLLLWLH